MPLYGTRGRGSLGIVTAVTKPQKQTPGGFVGLATVLLTGAAASVTISFAPQKMVDVKSWLKVATDSATVLIQANADAGANYDDQGFYATAATVANNAATAQAGIRTSGGRTLDSGATVGSLIRTMVYKNAAGLEGMAHNLSQIWETTPAIETQQNATRWNNTANPLTSLKFIASAGNLAADTLVSVSGFAA